MRRFVRKTVADLAPYVPIVPFEVLSQRLGRAPEDIVKLDANENPYGPAPGALRALASAQYFHIYPDPEATALRAALASHLGVPQARLLAGMGADELIDLVLRAVIDPGDVVVDCPPSFGMYPFSTAVNDGRYVAVPRDRSFGLDMDAIERAVREHSRTKVLFVCSPNNPDGGVVTDAELQRLLALDVLVVLDEAYVDFAQVDGLKSRAGWVLEYDNLVVLRTFSKLAGLAGLRVGYGAFPAWLLPHLWKIKQPYNVNVAASVAAIAALQERDWLQEKLTALVNERKRLIAEVHDLAWLEPYPTYSNFVLFRVRGRSARQLKMRLEAQGVMVRYFDKPGLDDCIRVSAGTPDQTDRLVRALHDSERAPTS
jgi:histidinol-phosphate aminotransferase